MDVSFLKTQWDAFSSAPVPAMLFLALGAIAAWWLKGTVVKGQMDALKEKHGVLEERARLNADKAQPTVEKPLETDDKGNVKPLEKSSILEKSLDEQYSEPDEFKLFLDMHYAYLEEGDCLAKATDYYNKLKSSAGRLIHLQQIEAEYLLSRFRCGASSALNALKAQSGPTSESFFANAALAAYYQSIGENQIALEYFKYKFDHAPDSTRKFNSALSLGEFLAEIGKPEDGISFLKGQMSYFNAPSDQAALWEAIGRIHERRGSHWRKHLCFEKSLILNPDNSDLRFSLAYSYGERTYGKVMAAHHYQVLETQSPRNSTVANNLSVIYDEVGAVSTKIAILRGALRRKDSAYVSANLATAYAKAGFLQDARECLTNIPEPDQHEGIVQSSYNTIRNQKESDDKIMEKLTRAINISKTLIVTNALHSLKSTDNELLESFVGEWYFEESTLLKIVLVDGQFVAAMITKNSHYECASYKVTAKYEPGLLELNAQLDESSLKTRTTTDESVGQPKNLPTGFGGSSGALGPIGNGSTARNLLFGIFTRPPADVKLILFPEEQNSLGGIKTVSLSTEEPQIILNPIKVHLTKRNHVVPLTPIGC